MRRPGAALLLLIATAGAEDPLVTVHLEWEAGVLGSGKAVKVVLAESAPAGTTVPPGIRRGAYGRYVLDAERSFLLALEWDGADPRLWIDADFDGDLAEERPVAVRPPGAAWSHERTLKLALPGEDEPVDAVFRVYRTSTCETDHVHFHGQLHRRGEVVLEGRVRPVALLDGNSDLRFDHADDRVLLDLDGDGRLDEASEAIEPGKPFRLGGHGYVARVPLPSGRAVEFFRFAEVPSPAPAPSWAPSTLVRFAHLETPPAEGFVVLRARFLEKPDGDTLRPVASLFTQEAAEFVAGMARKGSGLDDAMRATAARALGHERYAAWARLAVRLADDDDPAVCAEALQALHWMGYEGRFALFRRMLDGPRDARVTGAAARCLVLLDTPEALRAVEEALGRLPENLRSTVYSAFRYGAAGPPPELVAKLAAQGPAAVRSSALDDAARLALPEARALALAAAKERPVVPAVARAAAQILGRAGDPEAVAAALDLAESPTDLVQKALRDSLGPLRDPAVVALYLKALGAKEPRVRALAAELLAAVPRRDTTDALVKRLRREKDPDALAAVLDALGEHGDPRSVAALLAVARRKDPAARGAAIRALARIGPGVPAVAAFFAKLLDAPAWEDRVYALDAAAGSGDLRALRKVLANLDHKVWQVRHAAACALGAFRVKEAVEPMIARLEKEEVQRVRAALADALFKTTGINLYDFADTWRRWWRENGTVFEVPEKVPQRLKDPAGGTGASFYGLPLDSGRVIFVIDESGSMSAADAEGKTRLETAVEEVLGAVGRLKPKDEVNVIFFESGIHPWKDRLVALSRANRSELEAFLGKRRPTGGTNLYDGLELALQDKKVDTVFLLSDGAPGAGRYVAAEDILRAVRRLNQTRRIAVHCVSVGTDSALLRSLAAQNGGQYVRR